jgi:putative aldouronate transport system substrate-binding protein
MKKGLKAMALAVAAATILSSVATGCNRTTETSTASSAAPSSGSSSSSAVQEVTKLTVWTAMTGTALSPNNRMAKLVKEKLGFDIQTEMLVGDLRTKVGTMVAGGTYPDLMQYNEAFVKANAFIPLEKYLTSDDYPNLKAHYGPYLNKMKDPNHDNHIYYMPNWNVNIGEKPNFFPNGTAFWIQKAVLKEEGWPTIKTPKEYFTAIENYLKKNPTVNGKPTIGFEILADRNRMYSLYNAPEFLAGYPNDGGVIVDKVGDTYKADIFFDKETSKNYFKLLNEEFLKGVVDKEAFTENYDQYISKIANGQVLGLNDQEWSFANGVDSMTSKKDYWHTYVGLPLTWDSSIRDQYVDRPDASINLLNGYGVSTSCKDPDKVMHFLDTLLTKEWQVLNQWGFKDVDYKVDDQGHFYRTQEQRDAQSDPNWLWNNTLKAFSDNAPKLEGTYDDGNATSAGLQLSEWQATLSDVDKEVLKAYNANSWQDFYSEPQQQPLYYPCWQISVPSGSAAAMEQTKLDDLALEHLPKCVMAASGKFDSAWNNYVTAIHNTDVDAYLKVENEGVQYRLKNWGSSDN